MMDDGGWWMVDGWREWSGMRGDGLTLNLDLFLGTETPSGYCTVW